MRRANLLLVLFTCAGINGLLILFNDAGWLNFVAMVACLVSFCWVCALCAREGFDV